MERLTAQEESVMLYIWKLGSCFIRDILNEMPDPKPPYTSVASVVRNLEKKKYVTPKKFGTITLFTFFMILPEASITTFSGRHPRVSLAFAAQ